MVRRIFNQGKNTLFGSQESALSAAVILAISFFASALLGLVRDRSLAGIFGDSTELGVYFAANRLPNVIFNLLVIGSLSSALIPILSRYLKKGEEKSVWEVSNSLLNLNLVFFAILSVIIIVFASPISNLITLGKLDQEGLSLMTKITKICLLSQLILIVSSFLSSILQTFKRFFVPALTPVVYNLGIIGGIYLLSGKYGIFAPAWGMVAGALLHLLIQVPVAFALGYKPSLALDIKHQGVREVLKLLIPRTAGMAVNQLNLLVDTSLAVFVSAPSVIFFNFAQNLQNLPLNLFGVSFAQAILPTLSHQGDDEDLNKFKKTVLNCLHQTFFFIVPASVVLIVLRVPAVRLAYGAAKFSWPAPLQTAYTLSFFAVSLFSQSLVYLFSRAFFALCDTKTPLKAGLASFLLNILLSIFFVTQLKFGVWGLGLSFTLSSFLNAGVLFFALDKKTGRFDRILLLSPALKIFFSALLMGISLYVPLKLLDKVVFDTTRTINLLMLTAIVSFFGLTAYLVFSYIFKVEQLGLIKKGWLKIKLVLDKKETSF